MHLINNKFISWYNKVKKKYIFNKTIQISFRTKKQYWIYEIVPLKNFENNNGMSWHGPWISPIPPIHHTKMVGIERTSYTGTLNP